MSRFYLAPAAKSDLEGIHEYLASLPIQYARRIAKEIFTTLHSIGDAPYRGVAHSRFTLLYGEEVRSRLTAPYRIFYFVTDPPEIIAILDAARDRDAILADRLP